MAISHTMFLLPASLLALVSPALASSQPFPTAIRKQTPDSSEKILAEHLAFAPLRQVGHVVQSSFFLVEENDEDLHANGTSRFYPPFANHIDETEGSVLRRAAQALALLKKRSSCPSGMNSCADQGSPNKCCQQGTYCTDVPDTDVGHVACCPNGSTCGGGVGQCPADATSCAAALGGGCCIPGFVCQGIGCVPSVSATPTTILQTSPTQETVTSTRTTVIGGSPTTVIVTITLTASPGVETKTTTEVVTPTRTSNSVVTQTNSDSATGNPAWRPTGSSETTSSPESSSTTQSGCPTGFYGCLATHGGGCCRTDRDCHTYSCPPPSSTTVVSNGATVVVPATDLPKFTASATCAGGWFLCGQDAGPKAGCCPSGYSCGTASCFTAGPTETGKVQKEAPNQSTAGRACTGSPAAWGLLTIASLLLSLR